MHLPLDNDELIQAGALDCNVYKMAFLTLSTVSIQCDLRSSGPKPQFGPFVGCRVKHLFYKKKKNNQIHNCFQGFSGVLDYVYSD